MHASTADGTKAAAMMTSFIRTHGPYAYHSGLHYLLRLRSEGPNTAVPGVTPTAYEEGTAQVNSPIPAVFADGLMIHPSLLRAAVIPTSVSAPDTEQKLEPMTVSPGSCGGDGSDGGGEDGDGAGDPPNSDGDGDGDCGDSGDSGSPGDPGDGGPGMAGDPDTSESSNGTAVYEQTISVTAVQTCTVLGSVASLGSGLSAATVQAWASANPEAAAAFAASIGFASPEILIAFLVGIAAISAYYAVFCQDSYASVNMPKTGSQQA